MTFIYQPIVIRTLLENGGESSVRDIAQHVLKYDEAQVEYYIQVIKRYPKQVLSQHGVIVSTAHRSFRLNVEFNVLTCNQIDELLRICDERIQECLVNFKGVVGDHRYNPDALSSGSIRYEVLKRANGHCSLCGASILDTPIDIDHIIPRTKGGSNDISNLQALCDRCNRSKGNRDKTDFRHYGKDSSVSACLFCNLNDRVIQANNTAQRILDLFPVSHLHTLLIPKRHIEDAIDLSSDEIADLFQLAKHVTTDLKQQDTSIEGFNIGFNIGQVGGQTISHAHLHIIPRRIGDVENPRGGIRNVLPNSFGYNELGRSQLR